MSESISVFTIGFTETTAEHFFDRLTKARVKKLIDVRLHNTSQLSGFAKAGDLSYFLKKICNIEYLHLSSLAPTDDILKAYKKEKGDWTIYERMFMNLMAQRRIEDQLKPGTLNEACLLCSETKPHHCHRRLVCEYLNEKWDGRLFVRHL